MRKKYQTSLKKLILTKKQAALITLKEVQSAIKDPNSYSAPGPERIGTLLMGNGGDYLHKTIKDILNATCQ